MKCNLKQGLDIVCYKHERCKEAYRCKNVPKGIKEKLKRQMEKTKKEER